jgi:hypothetical protein
MTEKGSLSPTVCKSNKRVTFGGAAVIRVYDEAGNAIETHEHAGEFKEP